MRRIVLLSRRWSMTRTDGGFAVSDAVIPGAGVDLAVRDFGGSGPSALLLHGAGLTLADMAPLAKHLSVDHRVVGMDLRNHGRSGDGPWLWDQVLADIRAVITGLGLLDPIVIGHSLGGLLAAMYAENYADVTAAVNLDGHPIGGSEPPDMDPRAAAHLRVKVRAVGDQSIRELSVPRSSAEIAVGRAAWLDAAKALGLDSADALEAFDRKLVDAGKGTFHVRPTPERLTQMRDALEEHDLLRLYEHARAPQLVCVAAQDQPDPNLAEDLRALAVEYRRALIRHLHVIAESRPNVQVQEIDATHGLIYERPRLIADEIRRFRTGLPGRTVSVGATDWAQK
jgi:pimeloyl-ACP methyl ester carboxylesterase